MDTQRICYTLEHDARPFRTLEHAGVAWACPKSQWAVHVHPWGVLYQHNHGPGGAGFITWLSSGDTGQGHPAHRRSSGGVSWGRWPILCSCRWSGMAQAGGEPRYFQDWCLVTDVGTLVQLPDTPQAFLIDLGGATYFWVSKELHIKFMHSICNQPLIYQSLIWRWGNEEGMRIYTNIHGVCHYPIPGTKALNWGKGKSLAYSSADFGNELIEIPGVHKNYASGWVLI